MMTAGGRTVVCSRSDYARNARPLGGYHYSLSGTGDHPDRPASASGRPSYNRTLTSKAFSPLEALDPSNMTGLKVGCIFDTRETIAFQSGLVQVAAIPDTPTMERRSRTPGCPDWDPIRPPFSIVVPFWGKPDRPLSPNLRHS